MFEVRDHTADLAIHVEAPDFESLLTEAARALFAVIAGDLSTIPPEQQLDITVEGDDPEWLLVDWLSELLYVFDNRRLLLSKFAVQFNPGQGIVAQAWGAPFDPSQRTLEHEVKAITYHGLSVRRESDVWIADFVVDI